MVKRRIMANQSGNGAFTDGLIRAAKRVVGFVKEH